MQALPLIQVLDRPRMLEEAHTLQVRLIQAAPRTLVAPQVLAPTRQARLIRSALHMLQAEPIR